MLKRNLLNGQKAFLVNNITPMLIGLCTVAGIFYFGYTLDIDQVSFALNIFQIMKDPLTNFPDQIRVIIDSFISMNRIQVIFF